jgi:hypothetical protein
MRNGKSVCDTLRNNETDLAAKAAQLLQQAAKTTDTALRERSLFALGYCYLYFTGLQLQPWYNDDPDSPAYQRLTRPRSPQYQAWAALADFERTNKAGASQFVSNCDEYKQFRKAYK